MDKGSRYQCQSCGNLMWSREPFDIEKNMFKEMYCKKCHDETSHLWVGDREEDLYIMYNLNVDPKYF